MDLVPTYLPTASRTNSSGGFELQGYVRRSFSIAKQVHSNHLCRVKIDIRRLTEDDVPVLALLAAQDGDFDVEGRSESIEAPDPVRARVYLANPNVLFWISMNGEVISGFLQCLVLPIRTGRGHEVLVYEIGVRHAYRRVGVGRALMAHMEAWMRDNELEEMWVAADNPGAERFYAAIGYARREPQYFQPVYMSRELE